VYLAHFGFYKRKIWASFLSQMDTELAISVENALHNSKTQEYG
jgi:hypothetical protein